MTTTDWLLTLCLCRVRIAYLAKLVLCLLLVTAPVQAENAPKFKMHIFAKQDEVTNPPDQPMKMVVFNQPVPPASVAATEASPAPSNNATDEAFDPKINMVFFMEGGYQNDNVDWTIAAPTGNPNILSELQWKNVESAMFKTGIAITYDDNWYAEGNLAYGKIFSGYSQDSDYIYNNRQGEFSRSYSDSNDGATIALSGALGYQLNIGSKNNTPSLNLTPKLGYAFHTQQFNDTHGVQVVSDYGFKVPLGNFSGLNSTYESTWYGPFLGLNTQLLLTKSLSLQNTIEYHFATYEGTGNWNLRQGFQHPKSFTHKADGSGIIASAAALYKITPDWKLRLTADYQKWQAHHNGIDTTYFVDGTTAEIQFNGVNWNSYGFNMGVEYDF